MIGITPRVLARVAGNVVSDFGRGVMLHLRGLYADISLHEGRWDAGLESSEESGANLKHWLEMFRGGHAYRDLDSPEWICPETEEFEGAVDASKEAAGGGNGSCGESVPGFQDKWRKTLRSGIAS